MKTVGQIAFEAQFGNAGDEWSYLDEYEQRNWETTSQAVRAAVIEEAWQTIDKMIVTGALQGNGCDATAQRNGLVLAANALSRLKNDSES